MDVTDRRWCPCRSRRLVVDGRRLAGQCSGSRHELVQRFEVVAFHARTERVARDVPRDFEVILRPDAAPVTPPQPRAASRGQQVGAERVAVDVPAGAGQGRHHGHLELGRQCGERAGADDRVAAREDAADGIDGGGAQQRAVDELTAELGAPGTRAHDEPG